MKKIVALFISLLFSLFINAKGFSSNRFIPIDLERASLVSECSDCGNSITIDYLLYSPKTQYYYYPSGEICCLECIKCDNCKKKQEEKCDRGIFISIVSLIALLVLFVYLMEREI